LTYLRKLKEATGGSTYIFPLGGTDAEGNFTLCGFPVRISPSVAAIATGAKSIVFGDLSYFVGRTVTDEWRVRRFRERYAEYDQVAYCAYTRANAGVAKASTADAPFKFLQHA
jgi:HK97 family phage major capsid protein